MLCSPVRQLTLTCRGLSFGGKGARRDWSFSRVLEGPAHNSCIGATSSSPPPSLVDSTTNQLRHIKSAEKRGARLFQGQCILSAALTIT